MIPMKPPHDPDPRGRNAMWAFPATSTDGMTGIRTCATCYAFGVRPASWPATNENAVARWVKEHWAFHRDTPAPKPGGDDEAT